MAPKKEAKNVADKSAGANDPNKTANDARRTFEHLGRVQALSSLTGTESESLKELTKAADTAFQEQDYKQSADLLRAAEHLSFASIHHESTEPVADDLKGVITKEFDHLMKRAEEHAAKHEPAKAVQPLLKRMTKDARAAFERGSYRSALEFARGAEALAHVQQAQKSLPTTAAQKRLKS